MAVLDRIRLIGQLRRSPAFAGLLYVWRRGGPGGPDVPDLGRRRAPTGVPRSGISRPPGTSRSVAPLRSAGACSLRSACSLRCSRMGLPLSDAAPAKAISAAGKHVVIIGGGDTGADCLGNSHREQPASVTQFEVMPEPPPERPDDITPWPRWPLILRTSAAHEEGGDRAYSMMTTELTGSDGRVTHLHGHKVGPPPSFDKVEGSEYTIQADLVLLAMGFLHPQHEGLVEQLGVELDGRGNIAATEFASSVSGVFAAGDARRGQSLVVWAIAEGRQAARAADEYLQSLGGAGEEPELAAAPV